MPNNRRATEEHRDRSRNGRRSSSEESRSSEVLSERSNESVGQGESLSSSSDNESFMSDAQYENYAIIDRYVQGIENPETREIMYAWNDQFVESELEAVMSQRVINFIASQNEELYNAIRDIQRFEIANAQIERNFTREQITRIILRVGEESNMINQERKNQELIKKKETFYSDQDHEEECKCNSDKPHNLNQSNSSNIGYF